jgi:hypothetical protein
MKKTRVISDAALTRRIAAIRAMLGGIAAGGGIAFLGVSGFLAHASRYCDEKRLRRLLRDIEPYIPLRVTERAMGELIGAAARGGVSEARRRERKLADESTLLFLKAAGGAGGDETWRELVELCRIIRNYKEAAGL